MSEDVVAEVEAASVAAAEGSDASRGKARGKRRSLAAAGVKRSPGLMRRIHLQLRKGGMKSGRRQNRGCRRGQQRGRDSAMKLRGRMWS